MTRLFGSADVIVRDPVAVMLASCPDELSEIQLLWPWFENLVGLRGRKMYATADVELESTVSADRTRPLVEYYKRHDEIELWVPVPD